MQYSQVLFNIKSEFNFVQDILTQQLADIGFESFSEDENGNLSAYIQTGIFSPDKLQDLLNSFPFDGVTHLQTTLCEDKDWNEEWEKNSFQPIQIGNRCLIRAPFHHIGHSFEYEVIINPKMAFGTGTHQTTSLILNRLFQLDLRNKSLLDMGCGTAVLAILARKLGATPVTAVDIDNWCTENAAENCQLNGISDIDIILGDSKTLCGRHFDIILANINRNILLMDMTRYCDALNTGGTLIMSGFYEDDVPVLLAKADKLNLKKVTLASKDNWAMLQLEKTI